MRDVFELIRAERPHAGYGEGWNMYEFLVGSWDIDAVWFENGNIAREGKGEWHFSYILGGRGLQDVLFGEGFEPHQYGTTIRCYDEKSKAWHITWMQPWGGEFANLTGKKEGDAIVQTGTALGGGETVRWSFTEMATDSFLWTGEVSRDGGITWTGLQEMRARRMR